MRDNELEPIGDPDAESDDFAVEHDRTWTDDENPGEGETESPKGNAGLEASKRPN